MDSCTLLFRACLVAEKVCLCSITICSALARVLQLACSSGTVAAVQEGEVFGVARTSARFFSPFSKPAPFTCPRPSSRAVSRVLLIPSQHARRGQVKGGESSGAERCWRKNCLLLLHSRVKQDRPQVSTQVSETRS